MKNQIALILLLPLIVTVTLGCQMSNTNIALNSVSYNDLATDISTLAADSMLGRAPFTIGEERTVNYLKRRMVELSLEPAFEDSYTQKVPMVSIASKVPKYIDIESSVDLKNGAKSFQLECDREFSIWSPTTTTLVQIEKAPLIFAGFGINAPDYSWNDFKGLDLKGKIVVVLVNDPGYYSSDTSFFNGKAMTYYGRWTYKFEEAERQGALGCLIVHEDGAAGYPWEVAANKNNSSILYLDSPNLSNREYLLNGWITQTAALKLFESCGYSYEHLKNAAQQPNFNAIELGVNLSMKIENSFTKSVSQNVAGVIKGSDYPEECVIFTAHWDHLGVGKPVDGDSIYNGASDNAAAIAWLFSIAKAFKSKGVAPKRSVLFLSPTAEEWGLFGSQYFVENPPIDLDKAIACINYDLALFIGKFKDVTITGIGHSSLDKLLAEEASKFGRYVAADPQPENGMFFRSDQLPFLKMGIPSMFAKGYTHQEQLGREKTLEQIEAYWKDIYHKPADEFVPERDNLDGLIEDVKLFYSLGSRLANEAIYPVIEKHSEFYKAR